MKKGNSKVAVILCAALLFMGLSMLGVEDAGAQANCYWCCGGACDDGLSCYLGCYREAYFSYCWTECQGDENISGCVEDCQDYLYEECLAECIEECEDAKDNCTYVNECGSRKNCRCGCSCTGPY